MHEASVLIVSENLEIAQEMSSVIEIDDNNYYIATDIEEAISLYETLAPEIMLFAHDSVDKSEAVYFQLLKSAKTMNNKTHEAILLCNHENIQSAYSKCKQKLFYDYVVISPKFDRVHINISIDKALESLNTNADNYRVREFARVSENIKHLNEDISKIVEKTPEVKDLTAQSFDQLNKKMQSDLKILTERIKKRAIKKGEIEEISSAIDEEIAEFSKNNIQQGLNASQLQIDKIVNRWGTELKGVQSKHAPSMDKLNKLSKSTRKMVLIVEDNEVYGEIITKIVVDNGKLDAQLKSSVHHGLTSMVCDRPDIVLLDYELPDATATDFLDKVSQIETIRNIPVVMLTSHSSRDVVNTVLTQGAVDFIVKPANSKLILEKLRKWIS